MAARTVNQFSALTLVHDDGDQCASFWSEDVAHTDRPSHLIVGRQASDAALGRLAARWDLSVEELKAFRDGAGVGWKPSVLLGDVTEGGGEETCYREYLPGTFPSAGEAMEAAVKALRHRSDAVSAGAVRVACGRS